MNDVTTKARPKLSPEFILPTVSYEDIKEQQVKRAEHGKPVAFKVRGQLLDQGRTETVLAASNNLTLRLKIYAAGGENGLHAHANEDHIFVILQGSAEFLDDEGVLAQLGQYEGIILPKGSFYCFTATSTEPLVMLRIGSPNEAAMGLEGRVNTRGELAHGDAKENKPVPVKFKPNSYFG